MENVYKKCSMLTLSAVLLATGFSGSLAGIETASAKTKYNWTKDGAEVVHHEKIHVSRDDYVKYDMHTAEGREKFFGTNKQYKDGNITGTLKYDYGKIDKRYYKKGKKVSKKEWSAWSSKALKKQTAGSFPASKSVTIKDPETGQNVKGTINRVNSTLQTKTSKAKRASVNANTSRNNMLKVVRSARVNNKKKGNTLLNTTRDSLIEMQGYFSTHDGGAYDKVGSASSFKKTPQAEMSVKVLTGELKKSEITKVTGVKRSETTGMTARTASEKFYKEGASARKSQATPFGWYIRYNNSPSGSWASGTNKYGSQWDWEMYYNKIPASSKDAKTHWRWAGPTTDWANNTNRKGVMMTYHLTDQTQYSSRVQYSGSIQMPDVLTGYDIDVYWKGKVTAPPKANLKVTPNPTDRLTTTTVDASGSTDPQTGKKDLKYTYTFKKVDGNHSGTIAKNTTSSKVQHDFKYVGKYDVTVTVTNKFGKTDKKTYQVTVNNIKPVTGFTVSDENKSADEITRDKLDGYEMGQPIYIKSKAYDNDGHLDTKGLSVKYDVTVEMLDGSTKVAKSNAKNFKMDKALFDGAGIKFDKIKEIKVTQTVQDFPNKDASTRVNGDEVKTTKVITVEDVGLKGKAEHTEDMLRLHKERIKMGSNEPVDSVGNPLAFYKNEHIILKADADAIYKFKNVTADIKIGNTVKSLGGMEYTGRSNENGTVKDNFYFKLDNSEIKSMLARYGKEDTSELEFIFKGTSKYDVPRESQIVVPLYGDVSEVYDMNKSLGDK